MKKSLLLLTLCIFASIGISIAQKELLQSGPMVGYSTMREVMLWVQTKSAAKVKIVYYESGNPQQKMSTAEIETNAQNAYTAHLAATVLPGKKYEYQLYINGKALTFSYPLSFQSQTLWQYRTDPPAFKFAFGTCSFVNETEYDRPGNPYGGGYEIFQSITNQKPDFMLWGGDNVYLREVDYDSRAGILQRYTHTRSLPELQPLLASVHHYAIWDDHDYGPDNSDASYVLKETTLEAFQLFWANPNYGITDGITGQFTWADCDFFLLDNRWARTQANATLQTPTILGEEQIQWLITALRYSRAPFKFVVMGGQFLNNADMTNQNWSENYIRYAKERQAIIDAIKQEKISGVIFLTGDRHHTELSVLKENTDYPIYELTCSPLTSGVANEKSATEPNGLRLADTFVRERNFSVLEITGARTERKLNIQVFNTQGQLLWKKEITAKEIR
ncbi:MAG: alkaline phosphatase family protein [Cytophagales bacterium]|nr:MAG: alkaline phosphatase family protein [Cytophagales bacterium]